MHKQPMEDIDTVIGRFQAWAGLRNAETPKPGIRELTYEEALESRRNRWRRTAPAAAKSSHVDELRDERGVTQLPAPGKFAGGTATRQPGSARRGATAAKHKATRKARSGNQMENAAHKSAANPASAPPAKQSAPLKRETQPAPAVPSEFKEVLATAVLPAGVVATTKPVELARQTAISVRLAPVERALLRKRAAEAGITVSAYVRQCALDVEQLRAQVKQTLAALEQGAAAPGNAPEPPLVKKPELLTRLMRRFFAPQAPTVVLQA